MNVILPHPNTIEAQCARLLQRLRQGPLSTLEARADLDILHPAARVMELRSEGYCIQTQRTREHSACGQVHVVARYVLMPSGDGVSLPLPLRMMMRQVTAKAAP
jgi:hypothetical protein